jgi:hypothetical protein
VHRYGSGWRDTDFYAAKLTAAFPHLDEPIASDRVPGYSLEFERVYRWRFVEQFAAWFGLIERRKESQPGLYDAPLQLQKTPLFDQLFYFTV